MHVQKLIVSELDETRFRRYRTVEQIAESPSSSAGSRFTACACAVACRRSDYQ